MLTKTRKSGIHGPLPATALALALLWALAQASVADEDCDVANCSTNCWGPACGTYFSTAIHGSLTGWSESDSKTAAASSDGCAHIVTGNNSLILACIGDDLGFQAWFQDIDEHEDCDPYMGVEGSSDDLLYQWNFWGSAAEPVPQYPEFECYRMFHAVKKGLFGLRVTVDDAACVADDGPVTLTLRVKVGCALNDIVLYPNPACPDEITTAEATFACGYVDPGNVTIWSLKDNEEGCKILEQWREPAWDGQKFLCKIRVGKRPGNAQVKVIATHPDDPDCKEEATLEIPCLKERQQGDGSCCGASGDKPGAAKVQLSSASVEWPLGELANGDGAGSIRLISERGGYEVGKRSSLHYYHSIPSVTPHYDDLGLRQVGTPATLVDIVDVALDEPGVGDLYEVRFFSMTDVQTTGSEPPFEPDPNAVPFVKWTVSNPGAPEDGSTLALTKWVYDAATQGFTRQAEHEYVLTEDPLEPETNWSWQLTTRGGNLDTQRVETLTWEETDPNTQTWVRSYIRTDGQDLAQRVTETWREFSWGRALIERRVAPGGDQDELVTWYGYYESGPSTGEMGLTIAHDGSWTAYRHDYPAAGQMTVIEGLYDTPTPSDLGSLPAYDGLGIRATITTYVAAAGHPADGRVDEVVEYADGILVGTTDYEYDTSEPEVLKIIETRNDGVGDLTTEMRMDLNNNERVLSVWHPDGRFDVTTYEEGGAFDADPADPSFDPASAGPFMRTIVKHGFSTDGQAGVYASDVAKQDTYVRDAAGNIVLEERYVSQGGTFPTTARTGWTMRQFDDLGRQTDIYHVNGTHEHIAYEDCCSTRTVTDATGTVTRSVYDALGRLIEQTRFGVAGAAAPLDADVVTSFDYTSGTDPVTGQPVRIVTRTVTTTAGDVGPQVSVSRSDLASRLVSETDAADLTTSYSYGLAAGGGQMITVARPDGITEITEYHRDGRVRAVYGTGVVPQASRYEVHADGTQTTWVLTGTADPAAYQTWPRWTRTTYDMLGRVVREERPAFGGGVVETVHDYDGFGRLDCTSTTSQADTCYEYDPNMPNLVVRSGLDVDGGGLDAENPASLDRITETRTRYENVGGWWRVTETWVYDEGDTTGGIGNTPAITVQRERLSGFAPGVIRESERYDAYGNVTVAETLLDANAPIVTEIIDTPDATQDAERITFNGLLISSTTQSGVTNSYGYDGLGRQTSITDPRTNNPTFTEYNGFGVAAVYTTDDGTSEGARVTETAYEHDPATGRLLAVRQLNTDDPNSPYKYTRHAYTARGEIWRVWGDVPQPVGYGYNDLGERVTLTTFRADADWAGESWPTGVTGDTTTWTFDPATGLLTRKEYADGNGTDYTYYPDGKLQTRTWAREAPGGGALVTYYGYTPTGEMDGIDYEYAGGTPVWDIDFTYDRRGRTVSVTDTTGGTNHAFDYTNWPTSVTETISGGPFDRTYMITRDTPAADGGKLAGLYVGTASDPDADYAATYHYDPATARLVRVTGPGLPGGANGGAWYTYAADSDLVNKTQVKGPAGLQKTTALRRFEPDRDLLESLQNYLGSASDPDPNDPNSISRYSYTNDALGRRTAVGYFGVAFPASPADTFEYNDRNELIQAARSAKPDPTWTYAYDPIGNRTSYADLFDAPAATTAYQTNELNQYHRAVTTAAQRVVQGVRHDEDGNLREYFVAADMNCDGQLNFSDVNAFVLALSDPSAYGQQYPTCDPLNGDINGDGVLSFADINPFVALIGSGGSGLRAVYKWNADNRLIEVAPADDVLLADGDRKVEFRYDYRGRRIEKRVTYWNAALQPPAWDPNHPQHPQDVRKYIWTDWILLLEIQGVPGDPPGDTLLRAYTWGLDLAGHNGQVNSLLSAGGIGGLLSLHDPNDPNDPNDPCGDYVYTFDANGNVGQLVNWAHDPNDPAGAIVAKYEYDPYGNRINEPAENEYQQPFQFSTHHFDPETGHIYAKERYYQPDEGRWVSRDPIEEEGGFGLYVYVGNDAVQGFDAFGLIRDTDIEFRELERERRRQRSSPPSPVPITFNFDLQAHLDYVEGGYEKFIPLYIFAPGVVLGAKVHVDGQVRPCCCNGIRQRQFEVSVTGEIGIQGGGSLTKQGGAQRRLPNGQKVGRNEQVRNPDLFGGCDKNKRRKEFRESAAGGAGLGVGGEVTLSTPTKCTCQKGLEGKAGIKVSVAAGILFGVTGTAECHYGWPGGADCSTTWYAGAGVTGLDVWAGGFVNATYKWFAAW